MLLQRTLFIAYVFTAVLYSLIDMIYNIIITEEKPNKSREKMDKGYPRSKWIITRTLIKAILFLSFVGFLLSLVTNKKLTALTGIFNLFSIVFAVFLFLATTIVVFKFLFGKPYAQNISRIQEDSLYFFSLLLLAFVELIKRLNASINVEELNQIVVDSTKAVSMTLSYYIMYFYIFTFSVLILTKSLRIIKKIIPSTCAERIKHLYIKGPSDFPQFSNTIEKKMALENKPNIWINTMYCICWFLLVVFDVTIGFLVNLIISLLRLFIAMTNMFILYSS